MNEKYLHRKAMVLTLMKMPSLNRSPPRIFFVLLILSEPARSTNWNLEQVFLVIKCESLIWLDEEVEEEEVEEAIRWTVKMA